MSSAVPGFAFSGSSRWGRVLGLALFLGGCASKPSQESVAPESTPARPSAGPVSAVASADVDAAPAQPEEQGWADESPAPSGATAGPPPGPEIAAVCEKICVKVDSACNERSAKFCRASCRDYVGGADTCPTEIHAALSCQESADAFLLCTNIAAEACAPHYRRMQDCRDGRAAPVPWGSAAKMESKPEHPGFEERTFSELGLKQLVPLGLTVKSQDPFRAESTEGAGIFIVQSAPLEGAKLTNMVILRTASAFVGPVCEAKLRLHGRYEKFGVAHMRFDTVCKDGVEYHGMAHFWPDRAVFVAHRGVATAVPPEATLDAFLYGFDAP